MFQAYLAAAFGLWVGLQALINIGVNTGVLPTKGLTLPLMSYGRSSLLVDAGMAGHGAAHLSRSARRARPAVSRRAPCPACAPAAEGERMSAPPVLIMAGGTGGHVFPALALARLLRAPQREVIWLGTQRGSKRAWCRRMAFPSSGCRLAACAARALLTLLAAPFNLRARAVAGAVHRAHVIARQWWWASGGFVTGPGGAGGLAAAAAAADPRTECRCRFHQPLPRAAGARSAHGFSSAAWPVARACG